MTDLKRSLLIFILIGFYFVGGCKKDISLDIPPGKQELVVDGSIEQGKFPLVFLTKTSPYFSRIDSANFAELLVTIAKVTVSDGQNSEILTLKRNDRFFPPYYYQGTSLTGEAGKTYSLKVELNGKSYTAATTIPAPVPITRFGFVYNRKNDDVAFIQLTFQDPPEPGNCYRTFTKRLGKDDTFLPAYLSVFSDDVFNGKLFNFQLIKGTENISNLGTDMSYRRGDTVLIKFCTMDKAHYTFRKNAESQLYTAANPLAVSKAETVSMIDGALGVWGGYGVTDYQVVVK